MAKKISKGYLILEETCKLCDMPLMEGRGKKECRVCPAIRKWMNKHENDGDGDAEDVPESRQDNENDGADEESDQTANEEAMSDATPDIKSFMTADIRKRIMDLTPIPEKFEFSNGNDVVKDPESKPPSTKSAESKEEKAQRAAAKTEKRQPEKKTETAPSDRVDSSISVEDRAKQIIKEVRKKEGWDETTYPEITSPVGSTEDEVGYYQGVAEARAELIIKRARASLHGDVSSEVEQKSDVVTPELIVKRAKESLREDVDEEPIEHPASIVKKAKESLLKVESPKHRLAPLTPMSKLRKKQSRWLEYTASSLKMTSWDAARIIQSFARMVLSRKIFLEYLSDRRANMYRDRLTGKWKPKKDDPIFESRSSEKEENRDCDPEGEVRQTSSAVVEATESMHVDNRGRVAIDPSEEEEAIASNVGGFESNVQNHARPSELRISVDPSSENQVEVCHVNIGAYNGGSYTSTYDSRQFNNEDTSTIGDIYTSIRAPRQFNHEARQGPNTSVSAMLDLNQLHIEHQIGETSSIPNAHVVQDADVVNSSDMVHCSTPMMYAGGNQRAMRACIEKQPAIRAEEVLHADNVRCANPNKRIQALNDPPEMRAGFKDNMGSEDSQAKKRNVFAKVACSFDDAVSKVVSNMTACSGSGEVIGLKSQYKSAPAGSPLANGTYFHESKRNAASYSIMYRTSLGWTIVNQSCPECQMPMMKRPDDFKVLCVVCDEADTSDNATLGTMLRSEVSEQGPAAIVSQMRPVADCSMKPFDHVPTSIGARNMTNVAVPKPNTPKQRTPIDPEPEDAASVHTSRSTQKKTQRNHSPARSRVSVIEPPTYVVNAAHTQPNQRRISTSSTCSRSIGNHSIVSHQWKMTRHGCPRCNTHMMMNAYDNSHHCHSCGTVVSGPAQSTFYSSDASVTSLLDFDNNTGDNGGNKNPFVIAHQQMISSPRSMTIPSQQQTFYQPSAQQSNGAQRIYSFSHNQQANMPLQQRGHHQALSLNTVDPPTPNRMRNNYFNDPTPNHNRIRRSQPKQYYSVGIENSFGDANMSHQQMTTVDEAKQRTANVQNVMRRDVYYN